MIDPKQITNFNRTEEQLQEFLLFCIVVAGKNAHQQAAKLDNFLNQFWAERSSTPFQKLGTTWGSMDIRQRLEQVKMGQYGRISTAFYFASQLKNLSTITVGELEQIKGIGPKTARFFLMHSRPNQRIATLDTHILKWLRACGIPEVPKSRSPRLEGMSIYGWNRIFCALLTKWAMLPPNWI